MLIHFISFKDFKVFVESLLCFEKLFSNGYSWTLRITCCGPVAQCSDEFPCLHLLFHGILTFWKLNLHLLVYCWQTTSSQRAQVVRRLIIRGKPRLRPTNNQPTRYHLSCLAFCFHQMASWTKLSVQSLSWIARTFPSSLNALNLVFFFFLLP